VSQVPNDVLARYKRAVTDLRGSLNRHPGRSREILRDLLPLCRPHKNQKGLHRCKPLIYWLRGQDLKL
jgi:hypothetical protein